MFTRLRTSARLRPLQLLTGECVRCPNGLTSTWENQFGVTGSNWAGRLEGRGFLIKRKGEEEGERGREDEEEEEG